ncbi:MAG: M23 family metallopeptidase [Lachnospirales bacterium]
MPIENVITSIYGNRLNPITKEWTLHNGIDFNGDIGQKVSAVSDGKITNVYNSSTYGNVVEYESEIFGEKVVFFNAHLEEALVKVNDKISVGDVIGVVGSTGNSTGVHLHFSIIVEGEYINPLYFLKSE